MPRTGVADLPLHPGKAPRWLFSRMTQLAQGIVDVILLEYDENLLLRRLADPFWFQAFSCVLGFDWHSSGTTTVTCGALKMALDPERHGITAVGGKGKASKKAPEEIIKGCEIFGITPTKSEELVYSSRMSAKVDSTAIQDSYQLYHHVLIFTERGDWCVVQQGMNPENRYARRYHWLSEQVDSFVCEPHFAIVGEREKHRTLDMTSGASKESQRISVDLVKESPKKLKGMVDSLRKPGQSSLSDWGLEIGGGWQNSQVSLFMPTRINWNMMKMAYEFQPKDYEELISIKGVGPKTVRALALVSELVYGEPPSWRDPVKYSFAVGGKDGVPYPVDKKAMDESIEIIKRGIAEAKVGKNEKLRAMKRLREFVPPDIKLENYWAY
ncbi:MAG: DUF763 domain-containing protein [Methanomassiliicoccales archaeon]|nr:MAG: DUF763 domain-containing protein [Methanomassiliicoccales archaeon]